MSEPKGRGADWTEEREARNERPSDEGRRCLQAPRRRAKDSMSEPVSLEQGYRRLLAWYPPGFRAEQGEEMLAVLMAGQQQRR